ncbi:hypothetical protein BG28_08180 [Nesterenkonia sp. AN1]|nr:hypothetical protein BG28_08180 [Nesterenkonia sp. AN1]
MDTEGEFGPEQSVELPAGGASVVSAEDLAAAEPEGGQEAAVIVFEDPQLDGEGSVHATMTSTTDEDQFSLTPVSQLRGAQEHVPVRLLR